MQAELFKNLNLYAKKYKTFINDINHDFASKVKSSQRNTYRKQINFLLETVKMFIEKILSDSNNKLTTIMNEIKNETNLKKANISTIISADHSSLKTSKTKDINAIENSSWTNDNSKTKIKPQKKNSIPTCNWLRNINMNQKANVSLSYKQDKLLSNLSEMLIVPEKETKEPVSKTKDKENTLIISFDYLNKHNDDTKNFKKVR